MRLPGQASSRRPPRKALRTPLGPYCHSDCSLHTPSGEEECHPAQCLGPAHLPRAAPFSASAPCSTCSPGPPTASLAVRGGWEPGVESWPTDLLGAVKGDLGIALNSRTKSGKSFPWGWLLQSSQRKALGVLVAFCS